MSDEHLGNMYEDDGESGPSVPDLVTSVNGKQGEVVLTPADIGAKPAGPDLVTSVNTKQGAVVLTPADIGAQPAGSYASTADLDNVFGIAMNAIPNSGGISNIVKMTAAAYAALTPKVATTFYVIVG